MQLLQFLSSPNPDTFASIDSTNYNGPSLCDEEEIIAKTVEHCMPGYIEIDSQGYSEADATAYSQTDSFCYKVQVLLLLLLLVSTSYKYWTRK